MRTEAVILHDQDGFAGMRAAGHLAATVLDIIAQHVQAGITTEELDRICHEFIEAHGAVPAPLNYKGFPKATCISLNHVVCHGIPGAKTLHDGDILNID
ncbi:MAG: M24 family metallopeptidase, partial [Pseudomonadota bacterium]|nr:M24 family metallopeptidase [Pseudomonadota bacterium]